MKKFVTTILATSAAALGLFIAGSTDASAATNYTVKSGDSVWAISQEFNSTIHAIESANNIKGHLILPGQKLTIPDATTAKAAATAGTYTAPAQQTTQATTNTSNYSNTNNTASTATYTGGNMQSYVLSQMASRTGVPASTWNAIIQRESNWQPSVRNASSGAYGLFQNMHISGGSVQQQVDAAVSLYHSQGMGAWAL